MYRFPFDGHIDNTDGIYVFKSDLPGSSSVIVMIRKIYTPIHKLDSANQIEGQKDNSSCRLKTECPQTNNTENTTAEDIMAICDIRSAAATLFTIKYIQHAVFNYPPLLGGETLLLTHWDRDKMDAIYQTKFANAFSWMIIYWFRLKFHSSLFPWIQLTIFQHCFR